MHTMQYFSWKRLLFFVFYSNHWKKKQCSRQTLFSLKWGYPRVDVPPDACSICWFSCMLVSFCRLCSHGSWFDWKCVWMTCGTKVQINTLNVSPRCSTHLTIFLSEFNQKKKELKENAHLSPGRHQKDGWWGAARFKLWCNRFIFTTSTHLHSAMCTVCRTGISCEHMLQIIKLTRQHHREIIQASDAHMSTS